MFIESPVRGHSFSTGIYFVIGQGTAPIFLNYPFALSIEPMSPRELILRGACFMVEDQGGSTKSALTSVIFRSKKSPLAPPLNAGVKKAPPMY